jgi:acyl carrier protein phosphodiesterase
MCKLAGMNYLAHLHLGGDEPAQLLGSLYGDFVKGPLAGQWPADIEAAIRLHRHIDAYTDSHPLLARARARFPAERRRYAGILLDLFFDHCLALHWTDYSAEPLAQFTARVYRVLATEPALPGRLALIAPRMAEQDWLGSYRDFAVLQQVIDGLGRRLSRPGVLDGSLAELERLYMPLSEDFRLFYPELIEFARRAQEP